MNKFEKDLDVGDIHSRDMWQFELKSEFFPQPHRKENLYTQEFYFFIPNSLQVNEESYSKKQFYKDLTNFIRYKTPEFELSDLYDPENKLSPLIRLTRYQNDEPTEKNIPIIEDELKLLGNVARSSLRERVKTIIDKVDEGNKILDDVRLFCDELKIFRDHYFEVQESFLKNWRTDHLQSHFLYLDEFISDNINFYLTGLLDHLRRDPTNEFKKISTSIGAVLTEEKLHREKILKESSVVDKESEETEFVLYRSGLLNKFVIDALLLNTTRTSLTKRFGNLVGSISAGIAMLFFFVLFVWQGRVFIINSLPFIIITVFLYIIKDRIKETLKIISYRKFSKWFSDYITDIRSPDDLFSLGKMKETVTFISEDELPEEITRVRNREFHTVLESFKRPEQVIYYKKSIAMFHTRPLNSRRNALNLIFRFNIHNFLAKADDPQQAYVSVDPSSLEFQHSKLPKVYHLNIILCNTYIKGGKVRGELKKFRLIVDKAGIKRVEDLGN